MNFMPEKESLEFSSAACAAVFRGALKNVPATAYIERSAGRVTLCLRPHNLLEFGHALNRRGLQQCADSNRVLRYLDRHPESFIRFEHLEN